MYPPASGQKYAPVRFRLIALLLVFSLLALAIPTRFIPIIPTAKAAASDLFFSEYTEGSGFNKAVEIYNGTGAPVDLAAGQYVIQLFSNGSLTTTTAGTLALTGTVAANDVFVISRTDADPALVAVADAFSSGTINFNGDDALVLRKGGTSGPIVDVIGQVGFDPGTEWGSGDASTADNTIRRKSTVCAGDTNSGDAFTPSSEWDGFTLHTFSGFGSHTASCGTTTNPGALQFSLAGYSVAENGGSATINVTRSGGSDGTVTIDYATSNGSADAGDYTAASGTLTFVGGDTSETFSVPVTDDAVVEGSETVNLTLSNPGGGATLGSPSAAVLTITDNDVAPTPEPTPTPTPANNVIINEVDADVDNPEALEFVELYDGGVGNTSLNGLTLVFYNGNGDVAYEAYDLDGHTTNAAGYFTIGNPAVSGVDKTFGPTTDGVLQNGADAVALYAGDATSFQDGTAVTATDLLDALVYDTSDADDTGLLDVLTPGQPQINEGGSGASASNSNQRCANGSGGARNTSNYTQGEPTPDAANSCDSTPDPDPTPTPGGETGPSVLFTSPAPNATTAPRDASITVGFTEPVDLTGQWFDITCGTTLQHNSATVALGPSTWLVTPNVNFLAGETCTVTVFAHAVSDVDQDDSAPGTNNMAANHVWSFTVATGTAPPYPPSVHLTMGNPNGATDDINQPNNYLMEKPEYALSYNRDRGTPNWVSWHLSDEWVGSLSRVDTFRPDPAVFPEWYRVLTQDYVGSGFDRGHMVPNADRDKETSRPINQATFLMTNIIPQAGDNNQGPWADMENDLRALLPANELYIVAGGHGTGGTGSAGFKTTIANGKVTVPAQTWKVALVLPKGDNDLSRVRCGTRTIAVLMPNTQGIRNDDWRDYLTTVDAIEALTGYDFFSNLPDDVEGCIEAGTNGANPPYTEGQSVSTIEDTSVQITLEALSPNNNPPTFSVVSGPQHGTLGSISSPATCTNDVCTATVTYTPDPGYHGPDGFTFRASNGTLHSNTSTVSITVMADEDGDSVPDASDNCPTTSNTDQANNDGDAEGDVCDADDDNDGVSDEAETAAGSDPLDPASTPEVCDGVDNDLNEGVDEGFTDTDGDAQADCVDTDDDNDGVADVSDNCPLTPNPDQADTDGDGIGDTCDSSTKPANKEQCKNGGWMRFNDPVFKNQGDCIQFVNNGN